MTTYIVGISYAGETVVAYDPTLTTQLGTAVVDSSGVVDFPSIALTTPVRMFRATLSLRVYDEGTLDAFQGRVLLQNPNDSSRIGGGITDANGDVSINVNFDNYVDDFEVYSAELVSEGVTVVTVVYT